MDSGSSVEPDSGMAHLEYSTEFPEFFPFCFLFSLRKKSAFEGLQLASLPPRLLLVAVVTIGGGGGAWVRVNW